MALLAKVRISKERKPAVKSIITVPIITTFDCKFTTPFNATSKFCAECARYAEGGSLRRVEKFVRATHEEIFPDAKIPEGTHWELLKARVVYELQLRGHQICGVEGDLGIDFWKNYEAARKFSVEKFLPTTQYFIKTNMQRGEIEMAKKEVAAASKKGVTKAGAPKAAASKTGGDPTRLGKTTGLGVTGYWAHLFEQNAKLAKQRGKMPLTDAQITDALNKEFPERQSAIFNAVATVRSRYNSGTLSGKIEAPAEPSVAYGDDGKPIPAGQRAVPTKKATITEKEKKKLPAKVAEKVQPVVDPKKAKAAKAKAAAAKAKKTA